MPIKKGVLVLLIASSILLLTSFSTRAEKTPLDKADDDYAHQYSKYVEAKDNYQNTRNAYLTFKTAAAKNEAYLKTKEYLKQIDNVYVAYLLLVKEASNSFDWQDQSYKKQEIASALDKEIDYFKNNNSLIDQIQTLEETPNLANTLSKHVQEITLPLTYGTQAQYQLAKSQAALSSLNIVSPQLERFAATRLANNSDSFFANWNSEINNINTNSQSQVNELIKYLTNNKKIGQGELNQVNNMSQKAQTQLLRAVPLFEAILEIK